MASQTSGLGVEPCPDEGAAPRLDTWGDIGNNLVDGPCQEKKTWCWDCRTKGCRRCRRGACLCGQTKYGKDLWTVLAANLPTQPALLVGTAPGASTLPWDTNHCTHAEDVNCSGVHGCRVEHHAAENWNMTCHARMKRLREAIRQRLKRAGHEWPLKETVAEMQRRGVLHLNFVLDVGDLAACVAFVAAWRDLGPRHGFGFIDGKPLLEAHSRRHQQGSNVTRVAGYLAGYLTREKKGEASVFAAMRARRTSRVWSVSPKQTCSSRVTMRSLRRGRQCWGATQGFCERPVEGFAVIDWHVVDCATGELVGSVWATGP